MQAQSERRLALAHWLETQPRKSQRVYYPGLPSHPQHELAMRQQSRLAVARCCPLRSRRRYARARARPRVPRAADSMQVLSLCTNLGRHQNAWRRIPASTSHGRLSASAQRQAAAVHWPRAWCAWPVGLDHIDDITADLACGLQTI